MVENFGKNWRTAIAAAANEYRQREHRYDVTDLQRSCEGIKVSSGLKVDGHEWCTYMFATLRNCSRRFLGKKVTNVYFEVTT